MSGWVPEAAWGIGTILLLGALIYGTLQWHRRSPNDKARSEAGVARNYREAEKDRRRQGEV
ncbi:MAG: hypothetical protein JO261_11280 [Alphaproteobacteria bacterium]|nr:hypothetical protein [Alphaproteobacteria bacterium]